MIGFWHQWHSWLWPTAILIGSILLSLLVHYLLFLAAKRVARHGVILRSLVEHAEGPTRWIFPLIALVIVLPFFPVSSRIVSVLREIAALGVIAAIAWVIILTGEVFGDVAFNRYRLDSGDNLTARRVRTQIAVLRRIFNVVVIVVTVGVMLTTFPGIRELGASVLASAGVAGLVLGVAMKSTLSNLIAGVQIALTQPMRIEDVVIVDGEWGWIEEILTTYVVIRIWDLRRLVVPLSYFIEHSFQNWTRRTADLLAYVYIYCDYTTPVEELRQEFRRIVESTPLWDKKVCVLQVSDSNEHAMQVRALTSASDSSKAWDLKCYVREKMIQFLQEKYPASLPLNRVNYRSMEEERQPFPPSRPPAIRDGQLAGSRQ